MSFFCRIQKDVGSRTYWYLQICKQNVLHFSIYHTYSKLSIKHPVLSNDWSEFFQKVSIIRPGLSQKKSIILFYFRAATANFWAPLNYLVWINGKSLFFPTSRSLERPGLIIETLGFLNKKI